MTELYQFDVYQDEAMRTAVYPNLGENLYYPALGLAGEAGEVCEKIKKIMRDKNGDFTVDDSLSIGKELGDVLWYLAALCHELDLDMSTIARLNLNKLGSRKERGVLKGSGDDR